MPNVSPGEAYIFQNHWIFAFFRSISKKVRRTFDYYFILILILIERQKLLFQKVYFLNNFPPFPKKINIIAFLKRSSKEDPPQKISLKNIFVIKS